MLWKQVLGGVIGNLIGGAITLFLVLALVDHTYLKQLLLALANLL
jgi:hypothetical protein